SYDSTKNEFTYLDQSGATKVININDMVKNNETVTTLSNNNDGTYTYTNEEGIPVTINVVGDVTSNFSTIANNTTVKEIIENIVNNTAGNVSYDETKNEFTYVDQYGLMKVINITDIVKNNETVTTLSNNNDGSYTYTNEAGVEVKINVVGDVTSNFSTIANNTEVKQIIENIVNNTAGNVSYDDSKKEFTYLDQSGATKVININDMVKNNETVTTLSNNNDGSYTYTNEAGTEVKINVVGDVTSNFSTIANNTEVKQIIENIVNNTAGNVSYDSTNKEFTYLDQSGATKVININDMVKNSETVTTLSNNNNGTYTYTNEKDIAVTINVVGDVTSNFSAIANNTEVKQIIENIVKATGGNVSYNGTTNQFSYIDANGVTKVIDISGLITKANLTSAQPTVLEVLNGTNAVLAASSIKMVPATKTGQILTTVLDTDNTTRKVEWRDVQPSNVMGIKKISADYTVVDSDYTIIATKLTGSITITLPSAAASTGRLLVVNQLNVMTSGSTEIIVKFNVPVVYSDAVSKSELYSPIYTATGGFLKVTLQSDGTNWYVISSL
ncbi:autotransporter outer membrane beta-barrel domain-containing protein, partial [Flavobacterium branchiicola]